MNGLTEEFVVATLFTYDYAHRNIDSGKFYKALDTLGYKVEEDSENLFERAVDLYRRLLTR